MLKMTDKLRVEIQWNTGDPWWDNEPIYDSEEGTVEEIIDSLEMTESEKECFLYGMKKEVGDEMYDDEGDTWCLIIKEILE